MQISIRLIGVIALLWTEGGQAAESLSGKHLRVLPQPLTPIVNIERNASGHVTRLTGVAPFALELLAEKLNFTYELLQDDVRTISDSPTFGKGGSTYVLQGKADIICSSVVMTSQRAAVLDLPYVFLVSPFALLIPMPKPSLDAGAFWKPFQPYVWWSLIISLPFFIFCFRMAMKFLSKVKITSLRLRYTTMNEFYRKPFYMTKYTVSVLLSQGGLFMIHRGTAIRIGLAAFCLAAFVLNKAYSSVLISFATTPIFRPIIESIYDIPKNPSIRATLDRDRGTDVFFREAEDGISKFVGDMLRNDARLRCYNVSGCLDQVRGGSSVYIQRNEIVLDLIGQDYKDNGRCDFMIAKQKYMTTDTSIFAMVKNWPYTRQVTIKLMEMEAVGLFRIWWKRMIVDPDRCLKFIDEQKSLLRPLNFGNVSGAFFVLGTGTALSFLTFLIELIYRRLENYKHIVVL